MAYPVNRPVPVRRSSSGWVFGCLGMLIGCVLVTALAVVIAIPLLPRLAMQAVGFSEQGATDAVFAGVTPQPTTQIFNITQPEQVTINLGEYGISELPGSSDAYTASVGQDSAGVQTAIVAVDENGLYQEICRRDNTICSGANSQYQLTRVDFRPGGAVIYANINLSGFTQQIGAVLRIDSSGRQFEVMGIDVGGTLFAAPNNDIAQILEDIELRGNDALSQFTIQANDRQYFLANMIADDNFLTLVMQ